MRTRKHWSALPPIPGFIRIPDQNGARYAECDICHLHLPSLGVGQHRRGGKACSKRAATRQAAS